MRRKATMMGLMSRCSNCKPGAVTLPSFRALVCGYVAMAVLRTVVLVAVAIANAPIVDCRSVYGGLGTASALPRFVWPSPCALPEGEGK